APVPDVGHQTGAQAVRWVDGVPEALKDNEGRALTAAWACNADCEIVYGTDTNGVPLESAPINQPWFWTADGHFGRLDGLGFDGGSVHILAETTADGTMVLGTSNFPGFPTVGPVPADGVFLWTQATGTVYLDALLEQLDLIDDPEALRGYGAIALSANGQHVLLWQFDSRIRPVVLTLNPRRLVER
ncbi:MAG: hypothetical protein AAGH19_07740, partial [Pseudomonadota bacterium]